MKWLMTLVCILFFSSMIEADEPFIPHPQNQVAGRDCDIAITCVFQNEAPWIREWLEFHRLIGITHFYLYNNLSTDRYLDELLPYIDSGLVELFDFPVAPFDHQKEIYTHSLALAKGHTKWLAIIDTDEFIAPLLHDDLPTFLDIFSNEIGGVEISWQCFGTSDLWSLLPGELMIEKLSLKAPVKDKLNEWYKSIVRPEAVKASLTAHACSYIDGYRCLRVTPCDEKSIPLSDEAIQAIRINHYLLRTKEFFYTIKLPRIYAWSHNLLQGRAPSEYLAITNQIEDYAIQKYAPRLKAILFKDPQIHERGYWLGKESRLQHVFDVSFAQHLVQFLQDEETSSLIDFGCGMADYVKLLNRQGIKADGYDGNPQTALLTQGAGKIVDLSQPVDLEESADWGLSLAVGSYIPSTWQPTFIDNIARHSTKGIVISWPALQLQGPSDLHQPENDRIIALLQKSGFKRDFTAEARLRQGATLPTFRNNLLVFRKT